MTTPAGDRVEQILAQMTLDEKISMVHGAGGPYVGNVVANRRLSIPALRLQDGPAGVGGGMTNVTAFPAPIAVAASWDPDLARRYGAAMAAESRGKGANIHLAPMVNILRVPEGGRNWEAFGEDPHLVGRLGAAVVTGIQSEGVIAVAKHYADNNQEKDRLKVSAEVDARTQHEIYYPAFRECVRAGVGAVMCAYNRVNGAYASENHQILSELKNEMGFRGWVMSDWGATHSTAAAANAGLDQEMPDDEFFGSALRTAVRAGKVPPGRLDDMVRRILTPMVKIGLLDRDDYGSPDADVRNPEHTWLAREIAVHSTVLLKNAGSLLPIDASVTSVAVIGSDAGSGVCVLGNGSGHVIPPYVVTPLDGIRAQAGSAVNVTYAKGDDIPVPVPAEYLLAPDGSHGLEARFYKNTRLSGKPVLVRTDAGVNFEWGNGAPGTGVPSTNWSARWSGVVVPPVTGTYTFELASDDGSRLFIDGKKAIENWAAQSRRVVSAKVHLTGGHQHAIELRYFQAGKRARMSLRWSPPADVLVPEAVRAAGAADVALVFAGQVSGEAIDRPGLGLPGNLNTVISEVAAANPRTVVVLHVPGQVLAPWADKVAAVLAAWLPGQEAGNAIADVLFGDVNPAGKLPMTFASQASDYPVTTPEQYPGTDHQAHYSERLRVGYRHFDAQSVEPLFPFGHGLSYTTFRYDNLSVHPDSEGGVEVTLDVINTGDRPGTEVVQLYLGYPPTAGEPPKALKGFSRVALSPGAAWPMRLSLVLADLQIWDAGSGQWTITPGTYQVMVGSSSRDIRLTGEFRYDGTMVSDV